MISTFGTEIHDIRISKKLSLKDVAEKGELSHSYLSQIENGVRNAPKPNMIKKLAKGLNVPYIELLQKAGYIEEAEKEGLMKSAQLFREYKNTEEEDLKKFYETNKFDIEKLLTYDTTLKYRSVIFTEDDKKEILKFIEHFIFNDK